MIVGLTKYREFISVDCVQADWEVDNTTVNYWRQDRRWQFCNNFSKEVCTNWIHIVVYLSQEDRSFIWENQDNILDRVKGDSHGHEEEGTISVLHTLDRSITVLEKNNCEDCSDNSNNELDVRGLRETDGVKEVSTQ